MSNECGVFVKQGIIDLGHVPKVSVHRVRL